MNITTRIEAPEDREKVRQINIAAFGSPVEAGMVEALRESGEPVISLVAEIEGEVAGHIMFSPVTLVGEGQDKRLAGLAPMAVLPVHQRKGVGSALVIKGLELCRDEGYEAIFVLGHPADYPRFGFTPASRFDIKCEYDAPDEAFMALELREGSLRGASGTIKFHQVFG